MLINLTGLITEIFLYLLLFGVTFSNSLVEISIAFVIGMFIFKRILLKKFTLPKTPVNAALYILCVVTFITFLRSAYFTESIRGFMRIIKFSLLYFSRSEER